MFPRQSRAAWRPTFDHDSVNVVFSVTSSGLASTESHMRVAIWAVIAAVVPACALGCGKTPSQPEPAQQLPSQVAIRDIRISGPTTIAPGATGQFTAIAERSDGSFENVTTSVTWGIVAVPPAFNLTALQFTSAGMARGVRPGEVKVVASALLTKSNPLTVLVLEPGTFRVSGTVTSDGSAESAVIEVVSGTGKGQRTMDGDPSGGYPGYYALYGAGGDVELQASADRFAPQVDRIVVTGNTTHDFHLRPLDTPTDVSGSWILTLSASPTCRANLPEVARERVFETAITQQGTHFQMTPPTSPTTVGSITPLIGRIFGQTLSFWFDDDTTHLHCDNWQTLLERVSTTQWLAISHNGGMQGTVTGSTISATLSDSLCYWETLPTAIAPPDGDPTATCDATDHSVVLRRK
jgi:hypothetical protein